jgi:hypothetical protein
LAGKTFFGVEAPKSVGRRHQNCYVTALLRLDSFV